MLGRRQPECSCLLEEILNEYISIVTPAQPVRYTAVWHPSTEGEIQVYGWKYADYRAKYDDLWKQGWRLRSC